jgi:hypothetical protein
MIVMPPNPGFPFANEPRIAGGGLTQPYFPPGGLRPAGAPDGESPGFEKVFAESLSAVNQREDREREALRDRDIQGREGLQTRRDQETGSPPEGSPPRKADSPRETDPFREAGAPRKAGAPEELEAARKGGSPRETAVKTGAGAVAVKEGSAPPRPGGAAGEQAGEFRELSLERPLEVSRKKPLEKSRKGAGEKPPDEFTLAGGLEARESGPQTIQGKAGKTETPEAEAGGRAGLPPAEPAAHAKGGRIPPPAADSGVPAKAGPALKNGAGEGKEEQEPEGEGFFAAVPQELAARREEGPAGEFPLAEGPVKAPDGEQAPPAGETAAGEAALGAFVPVKQEAAGEAPAPEQETESPREGRGNGRRKVELRDYREKPLPELAAGPAPESPGQSSGRSGADLHSELFSRDPIPVDLNSRAAGERAAGSGAPAFEDLLARELRQNLNSDIVRHAQLVLRDRGEGSIRLSLRPESLGNVKIRLELTDNKIAGRIIVESGEALRAFEREIASLEQAFRDSGYESAELSAFLSGDGSGGGEEEGRPFYSPRFAQDRARYDEILERTDTSFSDLSENGLGPGNGHIQVNMLI